MGKGKGWAVRARGHVCMGTGKHMEHRLHPDAPAETPLRPDSRLERTGLAYTIEPDDIGQWELSGGRLRPNSQLLGAASC